MKVTRMNIEEFTRPLKRKGITKIKTKIIEINLEELYIRYGADTFAVAQIPGTKGEYRYFFCCPQCGRRCRVMYEAHAVYACGTCHDIHRDTLNRTKTDCTYYWERALREARKVQPDYTPTRGGYMFGKFPNRPKRMRIATYLKHWRRFMDYMDKGDRYWIK
ncbi:hypothetical protein GGG87_02340 [Streptococcus sp. zg-86]|uniref:Phage protein n=1 Tax=Streptococcus zhangguiae TaxID=2664091 RepID=A0A6I4RHA9_9STRE|nr:MULTISPECIES: hypothetical protein [unclassified Streptococcus]MTB63851.1 hypothetical protein [Streptococcus sp. zg-86]MTB90161.1 hypothetical protein [Streptococcus sp. zg-36]MWV55833.1 hypothetical protein [Streptococcus sp. zg-70]QTH47885.1 hypothetical protein J5M87_00660 [Streptococcus sp. zg-86]